MAKLKTELDSLDGLDDGLKDLYVEQNGKFVLDADLPDTSGLKSALEKERKAARDAEAKRKELAERYKDIDPDEYAEAVKAKREAEEAKARAEGNIDKLVEQRLQKSREETEKRLKEAQDAVEAERRRAQAFQGRVLDDAIRAAAAKAGLHQHAIDDALFRGRVMFTLDDAGNAVQFDSEGQPVIGKDGKTPFSPSEWLESMRETAPHWFPAGASGSGSGNKTAGGNIVPKSRKTMTVKEKAAFIEKHGRQAYEALPMD